MTWVRIDDQFADHPKIAELGILGPLAGWLHVCALCYCARYLTDGFISAGQVKRLASFDHLQVETGGNDMFGVMEDVSPERLADTLVDVGMWEEDPRGYRIHDYLDYNPSREQVVAEREQKREAGRRGGLASRAGKTAPAQAPAQVSAQAPAQAESKQNASRRASRTQAESNPVPLPLPHDVKQAAIVAREAPVENGGGDEAEEPEGQGKTVDAPILWELWEVEGWKRDEAADRRELAQLARDYPRAPLGQVIAELRAKAADGALKANPRSALRAFAKRAHEQAPDPPLYVEATAIPPPSTPEALREQARMAREAGQTARLLKNATTAGASP